MYIRRRLIGRLAFVAAAASAAIVTTVACPAVGALGAPSSRARTGTLTVKVCGRWSQDHGPFRADTPGSFGWDVQCGDHSLGIELWSTEGKKAPHGATARWLTVAPKGITIDGASVIYPHSRAVGDGYGWRGRFFWKGGQVAVTRRYDRRGCCSRHFRSRRFGWRIFCFASSCDRPAMLDVGGIELVATENRAPTIAASGTTNLWYQAGKWVRGAWPVSFAASDPSGICRMGTGLGNESVSGPAARTNTDAWKQCPERNWSTQVVTADARGTGGAPEGAMTLRMSAVNAAGVRTMRTETVYVDNSQPWVRISGRTDVPSTAGTQDLKVTAGGSPSGIAGISCRIDHGRSHWYAAPSARVPVAGVGAHRVMCTAENGAVDAGGRHGLSQPATWTLTIRRPTSITALFARHVRRRVVHVWVHKHGHWVKRTAIIPAHTVYTRKERIPFGTRTTIGGRLTLKGRRGLSGQFVRVWTAPNNGSHHYTKVAMVKTGASGRWHATLPVGPSRLIKAVYAGNSSNEPAKSKAKVTVPAKVEVLRLWPRQLPWGGSVHIRGWLAGGYLPPPPAGELVRLRIGYGRAYTTYGVKTDVTGNGHFRVTFKFGPGPARAVRHYWFEECALPADDYPYAPACSRKITVRVGG